MLWLGLTGLCGHFLAQRQPRVVAHEVIGPGLNGLAAKSQLVTKGIVATAFGRVGILWGVHAAL